MSIFQRVLDRACRAIRALCRAGDDVEHDAEPSEVARYLIRTPLGVFPADRYLSCSYGLEFITVYPDRAILSVALNSGIIIHDLQTDVSVDDFDKLLRMRAQAGEAMMQQDTGEVDTSAFSVDPDVGYS